MTAKRRRMMLISVVAGMLIVVGFLFNHLTPGLANQPLSGPLYFPLVVKSPHYYFPLVAKPLTPTVFGVENTDFNSLDGAMTMIQGGATLIRITKLLWSDLQPDEYSQPDWY